MRKRSDPAQQALEAHDKLFRRDSWARGRDLHAAGAVTPLEKDAERRVVAARVTDFVDEDELQDLSVFLEWADGDPEATRSGFLSGDCSCDPGFGCEHVVAALAYTFLGPIDPESETENAAPAYPGGAGKQPVAPDGPAQPAMERWLELVRGAVAKEPPVLERPGPQKGLLYAISWTEAPFAGLCLELRAAAKNKHCGDGRYIAATPFRLRSRHFRQPPRLLQRSDLEILDLACQAAQPLEGSAHDGSSAWLLPPAAAPAILEGVIATGRAHWIDPINPPLTLGEPQPGKAVWELHSDGCQRLTFRLTAPQETEVTVLPLPTPWYVGDGHAGRIATDLPQPGLDAVAHCPWLSPEGASDHWQRLRTELPAEALAALPAPPELGQQHLAAQPRPVLRLSARECRATSLGYPPGEYRVAVAELCLDYEPSHSDGEFAPVRVSPTDPDRTIRRLRGETLLTLERDLRAEQQAIDKLRDLTPLPDAFTPFLNSEPGAMEDIPPRLHVAPDAAAWQRFLGRLPELHRQGWRVETDPDFPLGVPREPETCELTADQRDDGWFSLGAGIVLDGERIDLLAPLLTALHELPADARRALADPNDPTWDEGHLPVPLEDGRTVAMPLSRLRPLLATMLELFDRNTSGDRLLLPPADAARLADLEAEGWPWQGPEQLRSLAERLTAPLEPAPTPSGLDAELRRYQAVGLSWLQRLAADGLSGVLADDMGLGKTLQVLAHLLTEREAGRADRPSLVVAPTSVVTNWQHEAGRFAPDLAVYLHHGPERETARIAGADLVVTSYALLRRDVDALAEHHFHVVALDEAQQIKNPRSRIAQAARQLTARQRLCLSGTPLENHLGELWSLFHFLMPGFLGDERTFRSRYRRPIEQHGEHYRQAQLAARIRPFLLRRTKERVAPELPEKTEITRHVAFDEAQRDLYEGVRLAVHEQVQQTIAKKGLARSQIEILDALLKLRQVCCDPRLVKAGEDEAGRRAARERAGSAKLQALMELLPELLEEGRRVLVFSQFTEMLALIEDELRGHGLNWSKLTGETRDRQAAVEHFQSGQVPLMLVSLKAGGTGLNLTAADTVIHYDPWWNPAAEDQATDRTHRIGQDQPVFVHRLICTDTVEERIQRLQAEKGALAAGLYGEGRDGGEQPLLSENDLELLLDG